MRAAELRAALDRVPRVPLVDGPTPVRRLARAFADTEVWLKDDSSTNPAYGGNKPRKLEYLIARAKAKGQEVVTFGFESSNHAVASALHCSRFGVPCHLVLVRGPAGLSPADEILKERKLALVRRLAASIETVDDYKHAARVGTKRWLFGFGKILLIPPGGSNGLGTLGYVRAALELAEQVERGELPMPGTIFLPLGTGGTVTGLAVGLAALGLSTRVVAAKVVPGAVNELPRLRWLARRVGKLVPELPRPSLSLANVAIDALALGAGYGAPTGEGLRAIETAGATEGLALESTYSGKALASLVRMKGDVKGPLLFWLTYSELKETAPSTP
ncbi:MAG: pyridoxal-phosphate dependent enzyme [Deltaproteobacteria bacterium]|nr:pyridoxal-phosphate dependent enzyme [Deltaproteobacteria bacterium]